MHITQQKVSFKTLEGKDFSLFKVCFYKCFICLALKSNSITSLHVIYTSSKTDFSIRSWDFEIWPKKDPEIFSEPAQRWGSSFSGYCCGFPHPLQYLAGLNFLEQSRDWLVSKRFKCTSWTVGLCTIEQKQQLSFSEHQLHTYYIESQFYIFPWLIYMQMRINAVCV